MAERSTAEAQLQRILYILPAARGDGVSLEALATRLEIDPREILRDIETVGAREYYHPPGAGGDIQIGIEHDRVHVWTKGEFERPVRLGQREALALSLGLRCLAADRDGDARDRFLDTAMRLEERLLDSDSADLADYFAVSGGAGSSEGLRTTILEAIRERRGLRIRYFKPGEPELEDREIEPFLLGFADNAWYLIAHCRNAEAIRVFRLDRIMEARRTGDSFVPPAALDPTMYLTEGRIYRADEEIEAVVRYGPRVARWVRERETVEEEPDGSVLVRHRIADPHWLVRHVLHFGADAEVIAPDHFRRTVRQTVARILARSTPTAEIG